MNVAAVISGPSQNFLSHCSSSEGLAGPAGSFCWYSNCCSVDSPETPTNSGEVQIWRVRNNIMAMTELYYDGVEPAWSYSAFYDYNDHNPRHELDPKYTQDYITRDMQPPIKIKCCSKCEDRLREALRNVPGVDSVVSTHHNKKLVVTGSADYNTIHYALKHIRKRHHHYMPQKLHNPFRLLFPRHSHSRFTPSWNQSSGSRHSTPSQAHSYYDNDPYGPKYGLGYGQAPEHHYRPGSLRHILFDSHRSSRHNHSGYTHH